MSEDIHLRIQYNAESVVIFEANGNNRYEVIRWTKEDLENSPQIPHNIEVLEKMVKTNPEALIKKIHGSVKEWDTIKHSKQIE